MSRNPIRSSPLSTRLMFMLCWLAGLRIVAQNKSKAGIHPATSSASPPGVPGLAAGCGWLSVSVIAYARSSSTTSASTTSSSTSAAPLAEPASPLAACSSDAC